MNRENENTYLLSVTNSSLNDSYSHLGYDTDCYSLNGDGMQEGKINCQMHNTTEKEKGKNQGLKNEIGYDNMKFYVDY